MYEATRKLTTRAHTKPLHQYNMAERFPGYLGEYYTGCVAVKICFYWELLGPNLGY